MNTSESTRRIALASPAGWLAFGLGSGLSPLAPGTAGTLMAIPFWWGLSQLNLWVYGLIVVLMFGLGVWASHVVSRRLGQHDFGGIVIDEMVGYWITMLACPWDWRLALIGFILFRVFDILKPPPIGWLDRRVGGGFGIMIDDVIAGVMAAVGLQLIRLTGWIG